MFGTLGGIFGEKLAGAKVLAAAVAVGAMTLAAAPAQAHGHVSVCIGLNYGGVGFCSPPVYYSRPVYYYAPPPVIVYQQPIYQQPVYQQPQPAERLRGNPARPGPDSPVGDQHAAEAFPNMHRLRGARQPFQCSHRDIPDSSRLPGRM